MDSEQETMYQEVDAAQTEGLVFYALELAKFYAEKYPDDLKGKVAKAFSLFQAKLYCDAKKLINEILPIVNSEDRSNLLYYLGQIYRDQGRFQEAEKSFLDSISASKDAFYPYTSLAEMFLHGERMDDAELIMQKGLAQFDPDEVDVSDFHDWMGRIQAARGNYALAVQSFRSAAEALVQDEDEVEDENEFLGQLEDAKAAAELLGIELPLDETAQEFDGPYDVPGTGALTINIYREHFRDIVSGDKTIEYREASDYWFKRIKKAGRPPFLMRVINGMSANAPELTVTVESIKLHQKQHSLEFHLGEVKDVKNWPPENEEDEEQEDSNE